MLNIYKNDVEKIKTICRLIIINILVLLVSIILFEPTMKSDDYDLAMVAYGAIDGNYSSILMYCSVFFFLVFERANKACTVRCLV